MTLKAKQQDQAMLQIEKRKLSEVVQEDSLSVKRREGLAKHVRNSPRPSGKATKESGGSPKEEDGHRLTYHFSVTFL